PRLERVADVYPALQQRDETGAEVRDDALQPDADAHPERAREDRDAREIEAQGGHGEDEADEDDDVVKQARERVRQSSGEPDPRVDVLVKHEANEGRQEKGRPDG